MKTEEVTMKLGLSARIIEEGAGKYQMTFEEFLKFAAEIGYQGVEIRPGQFPITTSDDQVSQMKTALDEHRLRCAFIIAGAIKDEESLDDFGRFLDFAMALDSAVVRTGAETIELAQKAADRAAARGVRLVSQIHTGGDFETVDMALATLAQIDRRNYGVAFEPGNLVLAQDDYGPDAIARLGEKIFSVSMQNIKPVAETEGKGVIKYQDKGYRRCLINDPEGVDFAQVFQGLKQIGFDGFATLIEPVSEIMDNQELARFSYAKIRPLV